jgi:hypothetical protein
MIVLLSLFICLIPKIFTSIDPETDSSGEASGIAGILWPLCFMFGSVSIGKTMHLNWRDYEIQRAQIK